MDTGSRISKVARAAAVGAAAGVVGAGAMIVSEKLEQAITGRPHSFVPARALLTLLGQNPRDDAQPVIPNHLMHWGTGAAVGALRGIWAITGIRGHHANIWHTVVRLAFDQTIENATGVGAPPKSWPTPEKVVDTAHKALYSTITGIISDRVLPPVLTSPRGRTSH